MTDDTSHAARRASKTEALRAAMARIEEGASTGLFAQIKRDLGESEVGERPAATAARCESTDAEEPKNRSTTRSTRSRQRPARHLRVVEDPAPAPQWQPQSPSDAPSWAVPDPDAVAGTDEPDSEELEPDPTEDRDADPYAVARAIVLRQLTMSPKSRHQLRSKLRERNCPDEVAEAVLDRMTEVGLIDDEKYAEAYVRSKQVSRGLSKRALAHELRTKGVDRDTADAVLDQVSVTEEEDRARQLVDGRLRRLTGLDRDVVMRRLAGMLARKGYPAGLSLQVIREAIDADPAFRRD